MLLASTLKLIEFTITSNMGPVKKRLLVSDYRYKSTLDLTKLLPMENVISIALVSSLDVLDITCIKEFSVYGFQTLSSTSLEEDN